MPDSDEKPRFPLANVVFDGDLDPLTPTIDCKATQTQLQHAREAWPDQWTATWANVEAIIEDFVANHCVLMDNMTLEVSIRDTYRDPQLTVAIKQDLTDARTYPMARPGALNGPKWMHN